MAKQENLTFTGTVTQELGNSMFKVELDATSTEIICTISGKIRKNFIKIIAGDKVKVEVSPYDLTKGRIVTRMTNKKEESVNNENINFKSNKNK